MSTFERYLTLWVGLCIVVPAAQADGALRVLHAQGEDAYLLGELAAGEGGVELW